MEQVGVILFSMGGPDKTSDIQTYLYNIFSDRSIIRLPGGQLLQKPFAHLISRLRCKKVTAHYDLIGGQSPLLHWTEKQAKQIEKMLQADFPNLSCYCAMRYFHPYIEDTIEQAISDGCHTLLFLPMYPQFSTATTGSSFEVAITTLRKHPQIKADFVNDYHDNSSYISLLSDYINRNIEPDEHLLFSAHSLPQRFVDEGDPYVDQIRKTALLAGGDREYTLTFQSRTGPVNWVGPDTVDEVTRLLSQENQRLFIVPISFVCDHIETLYELDIELPELVGSEAKERIRRMPMFNDDPQFAQLLAAIVKDKVTTNVTT